jgi:hypothetical protein
MKNIFYLLVLAGFTQLISCSSSDKLTQTNGQTEIKQKHYSNEQIEADAVAYADISCRWEVAKYNASLQENNRRLQEEEKSLYELKFAFDQKMKIRYLQIEDLKKKFNKALEKAHKQLSACEKLDVIREMEAEKEKTKEENQ